MSKRKLAVVDPHEALVEAYLDEAERAGAPIVAVLETHVQADHVSGLPALVEATGATAYLPSRAEVEFEHEELEDGAELSLGNTRVRALATPGHAPAHSAYVVADRRRGGNEPWLGFTGDSLLVGDVGRPDLRARVSGVRLGLRATAAQFSLLVGLNALVGAMVGLERSVLPLVGKHDFHLASNAAVLAFVVAFGAAKAVTNLGAGALVDRVGRKRLLVLGWLLALPAPPLVAFAPSWWLFVLATRPLGPIQGVA